MGVIRRVFLVFVVFSFWSSSARGARRPNALELIEQLKVMPPAQQRAIAEQYGVDIDSCCGAIL